MRRHLLTLLALLVLLMQPAALLHALSHGPGGAHATAAAGGHAAATADADDPHAASGLDCLQCLAFAAIGSAALPAALLLFRTPPLRHAAPGGRARLLHGGTGAGYHARGPPVLA
jgi:hypothetical protein